MEELCGQLYLMDLAFHSRVVRKLFHNYKHQLHNIMKYQLTLQKELNVKYQQEKQWKAQQAAQAKADEIRKAKEEAKQKEIDEKAKNAIDFNDADPLDQMEKIRQEQEDAMRRLEMNEHDEFLQDLDTYISRTSEENKKIGDVELRIQILMLMKQYELAKAKLAEYEEGGLPGGKKRSHGSRIDLGEIDDKFCQTEGNFVDAQSLNEFSIKYKELEEHHEAIKNRNMEVLSENMELQKNLKIIEEEAGAHQEALEHVNSSLNAEKRKIRQLEDEKEDVDKDMKEKEEAVENANSQIHELEARVDKKRKKVKELKDSIENHKLDNEGAGKDMDEIKEKYDEEINALGVQLAETEEKVAEGNKKIEELLKGGDYADDQLRIHIEELEDAVEVLKKGKEKWKLKYQELKDKTDKTLAENTELRDNLEQVQEKCKVLQDQLDKLKQLVKDATEAASDDGSEELEEDDLHDNATTPHDKTKTEFNKTHRTQTREKTATNIESRKKSSVTGERPVTGDDDDVTDEISATIYGDGEGSKSQTRKRRKVRKKPKLKMSAELTTFLGELEPKSVNKITFARFVQCDDLDPLQYLLDRANDLINMNVKYENVKAAMDVLATLLGYNGIDELVVSKSGQSGANVYATQSDDDRLAEEPRQKSQKKKPPAKKNTLAPPPQEMEVRQRKQMKPKPKPRQRQVQPGDTEEVSEDYGQTGFSTKYRAPGMNKRFAHQSVSPKRQHVQYYQEDLSDLAVSKKIHFNPKINREKMEEAEFLKNLSSDDELNRSMSKERMDKEISLFRMYLNLKKRYNKDPKRFLRIFKIYFGRDPPMNDKVDWSNESPEFMLTYDDFREYYTQLIKLHERCGDECIHLKRFYNKMGVHKKYHGKKYLVLNKHNINKLPASKPRRKNSLERLVKRYYRFY